MQRRAGDPTGPLLDIRDVEVQETEARTQAAVALLVDTSFSMAMDGLRGDGREDTLVVVATATAVFLGGSRLVVDPVS